MSSISSSDFNNSVVNQFKAQRKEYSSLYQARFYIEEGEEIGGIEEELSRLEEEMNHLVAQMKESEQERYQFWKKRVIEKVTQSIAAAAKEETLSNANDGEAPSPLQEAAPIPLHSTPELIKTELHNLLELITTISHTSYAYRERLFDGVYKSTVDTLEEGEVLHYTHLQDMHPRETLGSGDFVIQRTLEPILNSLSLHQLKKLHSQLSSRTQFPFLKNVIASSFNNALKQHYHKVFAPLQDAYDQNAMAIVCEFLHLHLNPLEQIDKIHTILENFINKFTLMSPNLDAKDVEMLTSLYHHLEKTTRIAYANREEREDVNNQIKRTRNELAHFLLTCGAFAAAIQFTLTAFKEPERSSQFREFIEKLNAMPLSEESKSEWMVIFSHHMRTKERISLIGTLFQRTQENGENTPLSLTLTQALTQRPSQLRTFLNQLPPNRYQTAVEEGEELPPFELSEELSLPVEHLPHIYTFLRLEALINLAQVSKKHHALLFSLLQEPLKAIATEKELIEQLLEKPLNHTHPQDPETSPFLNSLLQGSIPFSLFANTEELSEAIRQATSLLIAPIIHRTLLMGLSFVDAKEKLTTILKQPHLPFFRKFLEELSQELHSLTKEEYDELATWRKDLIEMRSDRVTPFWQNAIPRFSQLLVLNEDISLTKKSIMQAERLVKTFNLLPNLPNIQEIKESLNIQIHGFNLALTATEEEYQELLMWQRKHVEIIDSPMEEQEEMFVPFLNEMKSRIEELIASKTEQGCAQAKRILTTLINPAYHSITAPLHQMIEEALQT